LPGVEVFVEPVKEYRFLLVLRGKGLSGDLADTDPQEVGKSLKSPQPLSEEAEKTADLVEEFVDQVKAVLADHHPANMTLLRGFSKRPDWPVMSDVYGLKAAAIAAYPMYRGVARLTGMQILDTGESVADELDTLEKHWNGFDFFLCAHQADRQSWGRW
jgi:2,3-bisphosphoglycerate-independent phosphoglycerate mutase